MRPFGKIFQDPRELGLKPGTYKYDGKGDLKGHRFHLRVDSESKGVLLIDASRLVFLNGTALDYFRLDLEGRSDRDVARYMRTRYRNLKKATVEEHYERVKTQLKDYLKGDVNVIRTVGTETPTIGFDELPAPYRMDLALTYRCQNDCGHCYNETKD